MKSTVFGKISNERIFLYYSKGLSCHIILTIYFIPDIPLLRTTSPIIRCLLRNPIYLLNTPLYLRAKCDSFNLNLDTCVDVSHFVSSPTKHSAH